MTVLKFARNDPVGMVMYLVVTQGLLHEVAGREKTGWQLDWGDASTSAWWVGFQQCCLYR